MTKSNDAELHAIKELDPPGFIRWQLPGLDPDLGWYTWLESRVRPRRVFPSSAATVWPASARIQEISRHGLA